jgi:hypothetical protein
MGIFKNWLEDAGLGGMSPELMSDRGSNTPGSDEVKRTNLQPQVDAQDSPEAKDQDRVLAIDSEIEHLEKNLPDKSKEPSPTNEFRKLWDDLKLKWDKIKMNKVPQGQEGLGSTGGDPGYLTAMQQAPNMVPASDRNFPHGPGTFSVS